MVLSLGWRVIGPRKGMPSGFPGMSWGLFVILSQDQKIDNWLAQGKLLLFGQGCGNWGGKRLRKLQV